MKFTAEEKKDYLEKGICPICKDHDPGFTYIDDVFTIDRCDRAYEQVKCDACGGKIYVIYKAFDIESEETWGTSLE